MWEWRKKAQLIRSIRCRSSDVFFRVGEGLNAGNGGRAERAESRVSRVGPVGPVWGLNAIEGLNGEKAGLFRLPRRGKFLRHFFGCGAAVAGPAEKEKNAKIQNLVDY